MNKYVPDEPIAAIATAFVPSALAVIRVSGKNSIALLSKIFSRPAALLTADGNSIIYGWILDGDEKIDEVLASVFRAPKSFTGEESAEISCHGGLAIVSRIFDLLLSSGFRRAEKGEFTFRAFIHGKSDLTQAEAIREIIGAKTDSARNRAANRLSGGLFKTIESVKNLLVETIADIEAEIEYPEDENAIADSFNPQKIVEAEKILSELESSWKSEKVFQEGAKVVLAGRTNAGKSSLFNALLKEERAIVSDIAGTTRDFLESYADFAGLPVRLFDTAGLRETDDEIEQRGVEISKNLASKADAVLYLIDSCIGITEEDIKILENIIGNVDFLHSEFDFLKDLQNGNSIMQKGGLIAGGVPFIFVLTKCDKNESIFEKIPLENRRIVAISSRSGRGISNLCSAVRSSLVLESEKSEKVSLGSRRQRDAVFESLERVRHALALPADFGLDAVTQDLEDALDSLGSVTGETTPDDILSSVFSRFCVGK